MVFVVMNALKQWGENLLLNQVRICPNPLMRNDRGDWIRTSGLLNPIQVR